MTLTINRYDKNFRRSSRRARFQVANQRCLSRMPSVAAISLRTINPFFFFEREDRTQLGDSCAAIAAEPG